MLAPTPPTSKKAHKEAEEFYGELIDVLQKKKVPFMIGGTYAFTSYTGIERPTKDMDIRCAFEDYPKILKVLSEAGYKCEISEERWIAKVHNEDGRFFTDVIFAEKNGLNKIDQGWLKRARKGDVLGRTVLLEPLEDMICSKAYIQHRERFDGADVHHLILKYHKEIDWKFLAEKMDPHWEVLFGHFVTFMFIYPSEKKVIPKWLIKEYLIRAEKQFLGDDKSDKITRGLLISSQYEPAVTKWGFQPILELK